MIDFIGGGKIVAANPSGLDIVNFDPRRDSLDFGDISVHGLILGSLPDGTAAIVNPWRPAEYQVLQGLTWRDLHIKAMGVVGNEHLRQDIGGVLSWEQDVGQRADDTIYLRSHQFGLNEVVDDFDPATQKLNFTYVGTRERLSVEDTVQGLLISFEPSGQSVLLKGIQRRDLIGANLEFHHDQVEEDNLEVPFGFDANQVSLVSRNGLLTPTAPAGSTTDGNQQRLGQDAAPVATVSEIQIEHDHSMHDHFMHDDSMHHQSIDDHSMDDHAAHHQSISAASSAENPIELSVSGSLYWGGMSGVLTLKNCCQSAIEDWEVSFVTPHRQFRAWGGQSSVKERTDGTFEVTIKPAVWKTTLAAGERLDINFNADSVGLPNSGELDSDLFFADVSASVAEVQDASESNLQTQPEPKPILDGVPPAESVVTVSQPSVDVSSTQSDPDLDRRLQVESTIANSWSGTFAGNLSILHSGDEPIPAGWSLRLISDYALQSVSNFTLEQRQRRDGRFDITLSAPSWSANQPFQPGSRLESYYQASGEPPANSAWLNGRGLISSDSVVDSFNSEPPVEQSVINETSVEETFAEATSVDQNLDDETSVDDISSDQLNVESSVDQPDPIRVENQAPDGSTQKRLVTYFEEWGIYSRDVNLSDVDGQSMTHMNYSFFDVKADGSITLFDEFAALQKRFPQADQVSRTFSSSEYAAMAPELLDIYDNSGRYTTAQNGDSITVTSVPVGWNGVGTNDAGNFEQLRRFKELNPEVNLGFALGGWTLSDEFSTAYATKAGRDQFTDDVVRLFREYEFFNTVDFDWEYPGGGGDPANAVSARDGENFALVLRQLRGKLDALSVETGETYEVSVATAGGTEKLANLNLAGIDPYVDFYNVMTYDFHGGWENVTGHQAAMLGDANNYDVTSAIGVFEDAGIELNKVVMGAPAYTRAWGDVSSGGTFGYQQQGRASAAKGSFESGVYDYKDIVQDVVTGKRDLYWDDDAKAAFVYDGDEWSSMETVATIAGKAAYVEEKGLGGMMFWALSNDSNGDQSLVRVANDLLRKEVSYSDVVQKSPDFDAIFGGDGAFSLTDFTGLA